MGRPESQCFTLMGALFELTTLFDNQLDEVGEDIIQIFDDGVSPEVVSNNTLNNKVWESNSTYNYLEDFAYEMNNTLKSTNGVLDGIVIDRKLDRPIFNSTFDLFHGLKILVNDTNNTKVTINQYYYNPSTKDWVADCNITITDHFGLDKRDALTYQCYHDGFAAWWLLQNKYANSPFITKISFSATLRGSLDL